MSFNHGLIDDDLADVAHPRQLIHGIQEHRLKDGAQTAGAGLSLHGAVRDRP